MDRGQIVQRSGDRGQSSGIEACSNGLREFPSWFLPCFPAPMNMEGV